MSLPDPSWITGFGTGLVGAVIAAVFTSLATRRSAKIAYNIKIAEFRQAWINDLREDVSNYIGAARKWTLSWAKLNDAFGIYKSTLTPEQRKLFIETESQPTATKAKVLLWRIRMRINPRPNKDKEADDQFLEALLPLIDPSNIDPQNYDSNWEKLASRAEDLARHLLKREWEEVKPKQNFICNFFWPLS